VRQIIGAEEKRVGIEPEVFDKEKGNPEEFKLQEEDRKKREEAERRGEEERKQKVMLRLLAATLIGAILVIYLEWPETDSPVRKPASVSEFLQPGTEPDRKVDGMMDTSFMDPVTGMEFVLVRGGAFEMGDTFGDGEEDEGPVHEVEVNDFYMGKYEVRVKEFRKFVESTGYKTEGERGGGIFTWTGSKWDWDSTKSWRNPGFAQTGEHPVVGVSHNDVMEYIRWLNKKSGKNYRLPTEAEWEYAARSGGKKCKYSWGNGSPSGNIADETLKKQYTGCTIWEGYNDGYVFTAPVGQFKANELGLHDMNGNVWEWCQDWYEDTYYRYSPRDNPKGPDSGSRRVMRGGSWADTPRFVRTSNRDSYEPTFRFYVIGFRLVLSPR
jgi:sulfatase modifying factor 1